MRNYWKVKPLKLHFNLDTDKDKVKDYKDCRPFNPRKQHVSDTTMQRIKNLDIIIIRRNGDFIPFREAKKLEPKTYREIISLFKEFPSLLGQAERLKEEDEEFDIIYTVGKALKNQPLGTQQHRSIVVRKRREYHEQPKGFKKGVTDYNRQLRAKTAGTMFHEMKHEEQERRDPKFIDKYSSYVNKSGVVVPRNEREFDIYESNPYEVEADRYAEEKVNERYDWPTEKEYIEGRKKFFKLIE